MPKPPALQFTTRDGSPWEPRFIDRITPEKCTRCGFCRKVCPAGVFIEGQNRQVIVALHGACRGCGVCEKLCKEAAIVCLPLAELPPLEATRP